MTNPTHSVTLLTRAGCGLCATALEQLRAICAEFGIEPGTVDVDEAAGTDPGLRAEYGDRLPVVLLDGREHSYFDVDETRLRADLKR
ncbi:glutaredoxin family protein [Streptomyces gardneri]|jgi:glutaredoxin|uniref:glutaredoxin family protein n=1 Tax=Nocardia TaxID=1817 RepID=UPI0013590D2F|nr:MULTISPECIES: glutaredoxin family protein [Nocardia]MBF6163803.1 glutaredoxin family protein [Streptomyces gardneri]MBF6203379.1 glutaredoxin family protein [Streptomyces gardneri]UAK33468.1 glutaredoxin family protein [Nocardia asteroides]